MNTISRAILATFVYYDIQDFSLTRNELWRFCVSQKRFSSEDGSFSINDINESLARLLSSGTIEEKNGFFVLKGRTELYEKRIEKKKISDQKWRKALKIFKWFQAIPYVEAVFASGSFASSNTTKDSDLDVLIVTKPGRIWTCRFLVSVWLSILGARRKRYDKIAPDKVCLNHYITTDSLRIPFHSLYNAQTYAHLIPVWSKDKKILINFENENKWVLDYVNFWGISEERRFRAVKDIKPFILLSKFGEFILGPRLGDFFEVFLKKAQYLRIIKDKNYDKPGGRITINDNQLEFHPNSPEKRIIGKFNETVKTTSGLEGYSELDSGLK